MTLHLHNGLHVLRYRRQWKSRHGGSGGHLNDSKFSSNIKIIKSNAVGEYAGFILADFLPGVVLMVRIATYNGGDVLSMQRPSIDTDDSISAVHPMSSVDWADVVVCMRK